MLTLDLTDETQRALEDRAVDAGHAVEDEARAILEAALLRQSEEGIGTSIRNIFRRNGVSLPDFPRDKSPVEPANFD